MKRKVFDGINKIYRIEEKAEEGLDGITEFLKKRRRKGKRLN